MDIPGVSSDGLTLVVGVVLGAAAQYVVARTTRDRHSLGFTIDYEAHVEHEPEEWVIAISLRNWGNVSETAVEVSVVFAGNPLIQDAEAIEFFDMDFTVRHVHSLTETVSVRRQVSELDLTEEQITHGFFRSPYNVRVYSCHIARFSPNDSVDFVFALSGHIDDLTTSVQSDHTSNTTHWVAKLQK